MSIPRVPNRRVLAYAIANDAVQKGKLSVVVDGRSIRRHLLRDDDRALVRDPSASNRIVNRQTPMHDDRRLVLLRSGQRMTGEIKRYLRARRNQQRIERTSDSSRIFPPEATASSSVA